jgi:hypothetical protein
VSTDWHTFQAWLLRHGMADPMEAWEQFEAMAHGSSYADDLAYISHAAQPLPEVLRLPVVTGVAGLMAHLEISPALDGLCRQLAEALDGLLTELDLGRPASVAAVLALDPSQRSTLLSWTMVVHTARLLLLSSPRSAQIMHIAMLCNIGLAFLVLLVRVHSQQIPDPAQAPQVTSPLGYGLTVYTDAARRLNEALGVVAFVDPPLLGAGVDAS